MNWFSIGSQTSACEQGCLCWGQECNCPLHPLLWGAGGARSALHTKLFQSLLSCEGAFSGIADSLIQGNFLEASPQILNFMWGGMGVRIALRTEHFLSPISCNGALSGIVDSLAMENFSGSKPLDPLLNTV